MKIKNKNIFSRVTEPKDYKHKNKRKISMYKRNRKEIF